MTTPAVKFQSLKVHVLIEVEGQPSQDFYFGFDFETGTELERAYMSELVSAKIQRRMTVFEAALAHRQEEERERAAEQRPRGTWEGNP